MCVIALEPQQHRKPFEGVSKVGALAVGLILFAFS